MKKEIKISCFSLSCPERKSICCKAGSTVVQGNKRNGYFVCKNCGKEFVGGECRMQFLASQ